MQVNYSAWVVWATGAIYGKGVMWLDQSDLFPIYTIYYMPIMQIPGMAQRIPVYTGTCTQCTCIYKCTTFTNYACGTILRTVRADADLYKRIGMRVSLPPLAVAQRMEVTVGKGRGGVALTLKDASYH